MKVKTKRRICGWISVIGFLVAYGAAGGIECDTVSLPTGTLIMFIGVAVFGLAAYKGGYMR